MKYILQYALAIIVAVTMSAAQAHFVWLVPVASPDGTTVIKVYFGEDASDDSTSYLSRVKSIKLRRVTGSEAAIDLPVAASEEAVTASTSFANHTVVVTSHDLGVMVRDTSVFRLKYYAKAGPTINDPAWGTAKTADDIRLDIVPFFKDGKVGIQVQFDAKPVVGAQVKVVRPGMDDFEGETDNEGFVAFGVSASGIHSIRVRYVENTAGNLDGKEYQQTRHYSTVAVHVPVADLGTTARLQNVPQPVTSFGAAVLNDSLYMYGGHTGSAHSYSKEEQSNLLTKLDLKSGSWSTVVDGPHLQGLALVAHGGKLYRIGGFTAENKEGEEHKLVSQNSVACIDPTFPSWMRLPPLPEHRSSHDAAVVGDSIYVVGGWKMDGSGDSHWHATAWKMDLTVEPKKWDAIADPPFQRRALALAAHRRKLYVVGGMQNETGPTTAVAIYDPASNKWSEGPDLYVKADAKPQDGKEKALRGMSSGAMTGFGASTFATGGTLFVTTVQGTLQKLSADGTKWEVTASDILPRFFHRLLPLDKSHLVVVGGSNMSSGKFEEVEIIDVRHGS